MEMNNDNRREEPGDLELARLVRDLPREIQPERDLWSGIQRQIGSPAENKRRPAVCMDALCGGGEPVAGCQCGDA